MAINQKKRPPPQGDPPQPSRGEQPQKGQGGGGPSPTESSREGLKNTQKGQPPPPAYGTGGQEGGHKDARRADPRARVQGVVQVSAGDRSRDAE